MLCFMEAREFQWTLEKGEMWVHNASKLLVFHEIDLASFHPVTMTKGDSISHSVDFNGCP